MNSLLIDVCERIAGDIESALVGVSPTDTVTVNVSTTAHGHLMCNALFKLFSEEEDREKAFLKIKQTCKSPLYALSYEVGFLNMDLTQSFFVGVCKQILQMPLVFCGREGVLDLSSELLLPQLFCANVLREPVGAFNADALSAQGQAFCFDLFRAESTEKSVVAVFRQVQSLGQKALSQEQQLLRHVGARVVYWLLAELGVQVPKD